MFALHNVLADAPFSRVALVSCRNLLIYLDADAQARALNKFHFALRPGGVLFLGGSESLGDAERLFAPIDARRRVFRRDDSVSSDYSTLLAGVPRPVRAPPHADGAVPLPDAVPAATPPEATRAERAFLDGLAAPFALVDARDELTWLSAGMTAYVEPASGVPSTRLDALLMRELRLPARSVVDAARREGGRPSMDCALSRPGNGSANGSANGSGGGAGGGAGGGPDAPRAVRLVAAALDDARREVVLTLLPLESGGRVRSSGEGGADAERAALEREVASLRGQLDTALAGYDASARELRGSNEELLTMNVELQSANEELETSREELQSINEELQTMNAELAENNDLLRRANDDLQNLFDGGDVATLFVDRRLCVRRFAPRVGVLFGIRERDVGRPLDELARRFAHDSLERDARGVFRSLEPLEQEIAVETTGATFIMRMRPYRTADDRLDGVVLARVRAVEPRAAAGRGRSRRAVRRGAAGGGARGGARVPRRGARRRRARPSRRRARRGRGAARVRPERRAARAGRGRGRGPSRRAARVVRGHAQKARRGARGAAAGRAPAPGQEHARHDPRDRALHVARRGERRGHARAAGRAPAGDLAHARPADGDGLGGHLGAGVARGRARALRRARRRAGRLEGPALPLPPGQALAVGMALHELATNSVKHGALSVENGRVDVETWRDERGRIGLEWRERGGPAPSAPPASGFGRMLLERITPTQLDGAAELELGDEGVRYRLAFAPRSIGSEIAERFGRATGAAGADVPEAST